MKFNYHAWASRHTSEEKRTYSFAEHCVYVAFSILAIAALLSIPVLIFKF